MVSLPPREKGRSIRHCCSILWIHWQEVGGDERYMMSELDCFRFRKPHDVRAFRAGVRNIVESSLNDRLTIIKGALMDLLPEIANWEDEDNIELCQTKIYPR